MEIEGYIELTVRIVREGCEDAGYIASCVELQYAAKGRTIDSALAALRREMAASLSYMHREEELIDLLNWRGLPVTLAAPSKERQVTVAPGDVVCLLVGTLIRNNVLFDA